MSLFINKYMKWFKHENTFNNPKIEVLTELCGIEGYGIYFALLELIASHIETDNQEDWGFIPKEYSEEYLAKKLRIDVNKLRTIIDHCVILNLFEKNDGRLSCPKILERADDYFTRLKKQPQKKVRRNTKVTTNKLRSNPEQTTSIEEEVEEEQEIEEENLVNKEQAPVEKVGLVKKEFGDQRINRALSLIRSANLPVTGGDKHRWAVKRLFTSHGEDKTIQAMKVALEVRGKKFAPVITNYFQLEEKWGSLEAYINRELSDQGGVYDATGIS